MSVFFFAARHHTAASRAGGCIEAAKKVAQQGVEKCKSQTAKVEGAGEEPFQRGPREGVGRERGGGPGQGKAEAESSGEAAIGGNRRLGVSSLLLFSLIGHADPGVCREFDSCSCYVVVGHAGGISERQLCFTSSCSLVSFAFGSRSVYEGKTHNTHELFSCCDASQQGVDRVSRDDCVCVCMFSGPVHSKRFVLTFRQHCGRPLGVHCFCGRRCVQGAVGGTCLVALVFVVLCIACRKLATSLALFMGPLAAEQQRTYHFPFYVAASHRHSGCSLCATHYCFVCWLLGAAGGCIFIFFLCSAAAAHLCGRRLCVPFFEQSNSQFRILVSWNVMLFVFVRRVDG